MGVGVGVGVGLSEGEAAAVGEGVAVGAGLVMALPQPARTSSKDNHRPPKTIRRSVLVFIEPSECCPRAAFLRTSQPRARCQIDALVAYCGRLSRRIGAAAHRTSLADQTWFRTYLPSAVGSSRLACAWLTITYGWSRNWTSRVPTKVASTTTPSIV